MSDNEERTYETLGRDPFADLDWSSEADEAPAESGVDLERGEGPAPLGELKGKGVWLLYSGDVDLAIEMATKIGATHILYKTGHRGMFFVEAARRVHDRVRAAGLIPFAWPFIYCDNPVAEAEVAIKSARVGYEGIVFDIEDQAAGKSVAAKALGQRVVEEIDPQDMYYTSFPNIWQHLDIPYREMNEFCRGGFMPQCYPTFQRTPPTVIDKWAYGEHARWSKEWGNMPPLYPILAAYKDEHGNQQLSVEEFLEWVQTLAVHVPPFFSVYRAGTTGREKWPLLAALGEGAPVPTRTTVPKPAPEEAPDEPTPAEEVPTLVEEPVERLVEPEPQREPRRAPGAPQPVYHVVTVNDTLRGLCQRHGITKDQFWKWNGHLWDEHSLPHDALYMQEGWRVRVG